MSDLRKRATSGIAWSALERFSQLFVVFVVQIILARLLEPSQFGLIAMVAVFVLISNAVVEAGMGAAIVQRQDLQKEDISTIFFFNLALASVAAVGLWALGPVVANFYEEPILAQVLPVLGIGLLFNASGVVQRSLLQKTMEFRRLFWVTTPSSLISGIVGIHMAWHGYGVWALVAQNLVQKLVNTLFLWVWSDWRPVFTFKRKSLVSVLPYSSRLAASTVLDQVFSNIYTLAIGKIYSPATVGFYQRAKELRTVPLTTFQSVVSSVTFPIFSALQAEPAKVKAALKRSLQLSVLVAGMGMGVLGALAEPIVVVLLGEKWLSTVPLLQILCVSGILYPIQAGNLNILMSLGRSDLFLRVEVIKKVMTVANILVTYQFGVQAMCIGMAVVSIFSLVANTHYTHQLLDYGLSRQARDLRRVFTYVAGIFTVILWSTSVVSYTPQLEITVALLAGGGTAWLLSRFLPVVVKEEINHILKRTL